MEGFAGDVEGVVMVVEIDCLEDVLLLPKENQDIERESIDSDEDTEGSNGIVLAVAVRARHWTSNPAPAPAFGTVIRLLPALSDTRASQGLVFNNVSRRSS